MTIATVQIIASPDQIYEADNKMRDGLDYWRRNDVSHDTRTRYHQLNAQHNLKQYAGQTVRLSDAIDAWDTLTQNLRNAQRQAEQALLDNGLFIRCDCGAVQPETYLYRECFEVCACCHPELFTQEASVSVDALAA